MVRILNKQTNQVEEVDEKDLAESLRSEQFIAEDALISAINPVGKAVQIRAEDARQAELQGYSVENPEDVGKRERREAFSGKPIEAGLAGIARSVSLGLSD